MWLDLVVQTLTRTASSPRWALFLRKALPSGQPQKTHAQIPTPNHFSSYQKQFFMSLPTVVFRKSSRTDLAVQSPSLMR